MDTTAKPFERCWRVALCSAPGRTCKLGALVCCEQLSLHIAEQRRAQRGVVFCGAGVSAKHAELAARLAFGARACLRAQRVDLNCVKRVAARAFPETGGEVKRVLLLRQRYVPVTRHAHWGCPRSVASSGRCRERRRRHEVRRKVEEVRSNWISNYWFPVWLVKLFVRRCVSA
jgi:hypothetical protein